MYRSSKSINQSINELIQFYVDREVISEDDVIYCANRIISKLNISGFDRVKVVGQLHKPLTEIINYAINTNVITNIGWKKEQIEADITNVFLDKPSQINEKFYQLDPVARMEWFYNLSLYTNYIKSKEISKNEKFSCPVKKGKLNITINLSKPEKDPQEIAQLASQFPDEGISYPQCPLCAENVGFQGTAKKAPRTNHRTIKMDLNNKQWLFQFSPYGYFPEHCILIEDIHTKMKTDEDTVKNLMDFVDIYPMYIIGANADIPIVGGSILNHNHYQAGKSTFPVEAANVRYQLIENQDVKVEFLDWYLATYRITTKSYDEAVKQTNTILANWKQFSKSSINIFNQDDNNAINIIVRKSGDTYKVYVMLRNNDASNQYPFGIFHPDAKLHHIKKENIGLIEAMGLAILPGRLQAEVDLIIDKLLFGNVEIKQIHQKWYEHLRQCYNFEAMDKSNAIKIMKVEIAKKFEAVLESCNVFKYADESEEQAIVEKLLEEIIED